MFEPPELLFLDYINLLKAFSDKTGIKIPVLTTT